MQDTYQSRYTCPERCGGLRMMYILRFAPTVFCSGNEALHVYLRGSIASGCWGRSAMLLAIKMEGGSKEGLRQVLTLIARASDADRTR